MADEDGQNLDEQRDREQRTPEVDADDHEAFDEAFGSAAQGEEPAQETDSEAPSDAEQQPGYSGGQAEEAGSEAERPPSGGEQASSESQEQQGETWDQVGRELGALFESDESNITPDRVKHHVKTWHGRYKSERDRRRQAERELEKLRAGGDDQGKTSSDGSESQSDSASSESIEELQRRFSQEYGEDLPQFVEQIARARAREIAQEQAQQAVQPVQERQQQADQQEHYRQVTESHPDADQLADSDDLWQWIDSQPQAYRDFYNQVAETGSAEDVIRMLSDYKAARGMAGSTPEQSTEADQASGASSADGEGDAQPARRKAPQRPPSRSPSGPRRGDADPNDFDSAFDEALRA